MLSNLHPQISDSSILIGRGSDVVNFGLTFMANCGLYLEADWFFWLLGWMLVLLQG